MAQGGPIDGSPGISHLLVHSGWRGGGALVEEYMAEGHCLFEGRYPLPNYRPCFLALSTRQFSLTVPYF